MPIIKNFKLHRVVVFNLLSQFIEDSRDSAAINLPFMTTNYPLHLTTNVTRRTNIDGSTNQSLFSSPHDNELICEDNFSEAENSLKEPAKFELDSPREPLRYSINNHHSQRPSESFIDNERNPDERANGGFWIYSDFESALHVPRFTGGDLLQDSWLKKRPENPSHVYPKLEFNLGPSQKATTPKKKFKKGVGCSCTKSKCLRLHCKCFRTLGFCSKDCGCVDCFNEPRFEAERESVIHMMKKIYPQAFVSKIVKADDQLALNSQGCRCKTGCSKNYCDCYRNGIGCSPICKCHSCTNKKVEIGIPEVRKHYDSGNRTKDKIIIVVPDDRFKQIDKKFSREEDSRDTNEHDSRSDTRKCLVVFRNYQKPEDCGRKDHISLDSLKLE